MKTIETMQGIREVSPSLARNFIDTGGQFLIQFSTTDCPVSEVFEPILQEFQDAHKDIEVLKVNIECAANSTELPFVADFLFSPSYAAFEGSMLVGHTNTASLGIFDTLFNAEELDAYV